MILMAFWAHSNVAVAFMPLGTDVVVVVEVVDVVDVVDVVEVVDVDVVEVVDVVDVVDVGPLDGIVVVDTEAGEVVGADEVLGASVVVGCELASVVVVELIELGVTEVVGIPDDS